MTANHKLDIFKTLSHISKKDISFYDNLTEEELKGLHPLVVMRWLSGTQDARQIFFLNELVNPFVFNMTKHKQLLYNLMTTCTSGKDQRYHWNKVTSKKTTNTPEIIKIIRKYFGYNTLQSIDAVKLLSDENILKYAEHLGYQKEEIAKVKRELKKR